MITGKFLTTANMISIARVPLAAGAALLLRSGFRIEALILMVLATASDGVDGAVARRTGTVSDWGKILDPAADKVSFLIMAFTLVDLDLFPLWILWLLLARDGLIAFGGFIMSKRLKPPSANLLGKLSTVVLALYMIRQVISPGDEVLLGSSIFGLLAALFIIVSFATYIVVFIRSNWKINAS